MDDSNWYVRIKSLPRTRDGKFSPTLFERYQRNEKALLAYMLEMYISGVSTRKVSHIVEQLCGTSVSKSLLTAELDPMVKEWRDRSLSETDYPYIVTDVLYIKVREDNRVISKNCHIAIGINEYGYREIIGFLIQDGESGLTWSNFFEHLKNRDLKDTKLVISDSHKGLVSAIRESFTGVSWQRCQVHFMRNILSYVPKKDSKTLREAIKAIFHYTDIELARNAKNELIDKFSDNKRYEKACEILDDGFEDAFQYTVVAKGHSRLKSTNVIERLNQEVRRQEKVVRIFPNTESAIRLIGAVLMDIHEEWIGSNRRYIQF
ncbi:transposase-like protein [Virgibacillus campisalis]|uniref:Mutator family transposase n=1 Tax=Virgibacillus alimentarius TaxID=698769 RepID=A0ABS4SBM7_9BACI|nr:transposase-like protein [Virgibacillus alimentarius]